MNERPTFSPFWHRVRTMRPKLRSHVQITRQHYRGRRWHVIHDPTSNQFFRLNPVAYDFVGMLDGAREVEAAWHASLEKFGDLAPTQNEIIQLISQLYQSNLLSCDASPETEQLLRRGRERVKKKAIAQAIGIMYLKIRLFNPDRLLTAAEPVLRPILNRWGFLAWCALVLWALISVIPHWDKLAANFNQQHIFDPQFLWLIPFAFIITKAIHEFGHGVVCKRLGGQVPEFGVMLLVLLPSPYVDASSAWAFSNKWQRVAVGAAGMMFELVVAAIACFVWIAQQESGQGESVLARFCFNIMVTSGISTVLFNANPLMRFDGYYILADFLEVPNLANRSNKMLLHLFQRFVYRLKNLTPPTTQADERLILIVYGILAFAYRIFLFISITLYVLGQFFAIGLVLAVWTAAAWFLIPIGKFVHWLASSPMLSEHRTRSVAISVALITLAVITVGVIPMPDRRHGSGVVDSLAKTNIYFGTDGFVAVVHKRPGERVNAGDPLATLENRDLIEQRTGLLAQVDEIRVMIRDGVAKGDPAVADLAAERLRIGLENLAELDRRIRDLTVLAPHAGVVAGDDPAQKLGAFVKRGDPVCTVVDPAAIRIAATLDQRQAEWLLTSAEQRGEPLICQIRLISNVSTIVTADRYEPVPAGQRLLPSAALGFSGGGRFEVDPQDQSGRVAKRPQFNVYIYPAAGDNLASSVLPGERVVVRFKLPTRPLFAQWIDRLRKEIQGRVNI
ncbi:MAG: PqqD family peptide modification chaperone [Phycisphaerales bacterium]|nr:PqqD family peptide modification chaperone [Phycisphaerales bacterium]